MRRATLADVPKLFELGAAMHAESRYKKFRLNQEKSEAFFASIIDDKRFIVLVDGEPIHAMLIAFVSDFWWGDDTESSDLIIYVAPDRRGGISAARLIRGYVSIAESMGVADIKIGVSSGIDTERTLRFFERLGFQSFASNCTLADGPAAVH